MFSFGPRDGCVAQGLTYLVDRESGTFHPGRVSRVVDCQISRLRCVEPHRSRREGSHEIYTGCDYVTLGRSLANEVAAKGFAVFAVHEGDPEAAVRRAVNFGRDTDCLAAVAGGLAGTLTGAAGCLPTGSSR